MWAPYYPHFKDFVRSWLQINIFLTNRPSGAAAPPECGCGSAIAAVLDQWPKG
jgi:hypothetical protein